MQVVLWFGPFVPTFSQRTTLQVRYGKAATIEQAPMLPATSAESYAVALEQWEESQGKSIVAVSGDYPAWISAACDRLMLKASPVQPDGGLA